METLQEAIEKENETDSRPPCFAKGASVVPGRVRPTLYKRCLSPKFLAGLGPVIESRFPPDAWGVG